MHQHCRRRFFVSYMMSRGLLLVMYQHGVVDGVKAGRADDQWTLRCTYYSLKIVMAQWHCGTADAKLKKVQVR
jgi:hypothetical protein